MAVASSDFPLREERASTPGRGNSAARPGAAKTNGDFEAQCESPCG